MWFNYEDRSISVGKDRAPIASGTTYRLQSPATQLRDTLLTELQKFHDIFWFAEIRGLRFETQSPCFPLSSTTQQALQNDVGTTSGWAVRMYPVYIQFFPHKSLGFL